MKCASIIISVEDGYIHFPKNGNIMPHTYAVYHSFTLKRKKLQKNTRFLLDIFVLFPLQSKKKGRRCHVHQVPYSDCSRLHTRRRLPFVHSVSGKNVLPGAFQLRKSGRRHAYFSVFNGVFILPRGLYGGARSPALRAFNGLQVFVLLLRSVHTRKAKGKAAPVPHIIQKAQLHHGAAAHGKRTFPV